MCNILLSALKAKAGHANSAMSAQARQSHQEMDEIGDIPFYLFAIGPDVQCGQSSVHRAAEKLSYHRIKERGYSQDSTKKSTTVIKDLTEVPSGMESMSSTSGAELRVFPIAGELDLLSFAERRMPRPSRIELATQWIHTCSMTHKACGHIENTDLPTRIIHCGSSGIDPRLIRTSGLKGQYVTLSHCWGEVKPPVTTKHNINDRLLRIPYSTLPQTFRDAVDVVRKLGFQYLWIDSFCILQEDEEDWKRESALMGGYYSQSALTITGPAAENAFAGFLHHTCPCPTGDDNRLLFQFGEKSILVGFGVDSYPFILSYPEPSAIDTRAWIVQERLLSHRVLYFGKEQSYFECNTAMNFETLEHPIKATKRFLRGDPGWRIQKGALLEPNLTTWYLIMDTFGLTNLTEAKDKLPSVSGLARSFADAFDDAYLAGLWSKDLAFGLSWRASEHIQQRTLKPARYSGPSWSWTSTTKSFHYPLTDVLGHDDHVPWNAWEGELDAVKTGKIAFCVEVTPTELTLAGDDKFGEVIAGSISVTGKILQCILSCDILVPPDWRCDFQFASFHPDGDIFSLPDDCAVECLLLAYHDGSNIRHNIGFSSTLIAALLGADRPRWFGLVLQRVKGVDNTYRRIGMAIAETRGNEDRKVDTGLRHFFTRDSRQVTVI